MQSFFNKVVVDIACVNAIGVQIQVGRALEPADTQTVRNKRRHLAHVDMEISIDIVARLVDVRSREFYGSLALVGFKMQSVKFQTNRSVSVEFSCRKVNINANIFHLRIIINQDQTIIESEFCLNVRITCCIADISANIGTKMQLALQFFHPNLIEQTVGRKFHNISKVDIVATGVNVGVDAVGQPCRAADGNQNIVERERHIVDSNVLTHIIDIQPQFGHLQFIGVGRIIINIRNLHITFYLCLNQTIGKRTFCRDFRDIGFGVRPKFLVIVNKCYIADCQLLKVDNQTKSRGVGNFWRGIGRH